MCFILIMVCNSAQKCSTVVAKGHRLLDSFLMVPEVQFGLKIADIVSGDQNFF